MMISPQTFIFEKKDESFEELIKSRDKLIRKVRHLEKVVFSDERTSEEWSYCPSPEVQYQMNLEYLAELLMFMKEKYSKEIVWGDTSVEDEE